MGGSLGAMGVSLGAMGGSQSPRAPPGCWVPCKWPWAALQQLCRDQRLWCRALGVSRRSHGRFEVEYLCDYRRVRDEEFYLVKWCGYPSSSNTWEPRKNLHCRGLLKQLHQDLERVPGGPARPGPRGLPARATSYLVQKAKQRQALRRWERLLNNTRSHRGRIMVENEVDLHGPPSDFVYINEYKVGAGVNLVPVAVGCECGDCLANAVGGCCPGASSNKFAYNEAGQVCIRAGLPIYECNSRCRCGADCPNRVVQKGIRYDLCIFRTGDGRGWGVRTLQRIRKNSFVMEYVGEMILSIALRWAGVVQGPRWTRLEALQVGLDGLGGLLRAKRWWLSPDHHVRGGRAPGPSLRPARGHLPLRPGLCGGCLHRRCCPLWQHLPLRQPQLRPQPAGLQRLYRESG
ncbi:histone-lysine N-methyltransferase SUV39H1 isoform X3 [Cuculus canorus]|uniref:histone-lysine N-methyltransferase SUV39H1 isoform X3 n=1 Tax=Cuculus canorus TaxID=55661 RepID=UPI0023AB4612|nr:histone-lysine N-methyltransferase SUV39H1 isoform X3 [Cuculus canorus]